MAIQHYSTPHILCECAVELASALTAATILADAAVTPTISEMTYDVSRGTLDHTQSTNRYYSTVCIHWCPNDELERQVQARSLGPCRPAAAALCCGRDSPSPTSRCAERTVEQWDWRTKWAALQCRATQRSPDSEDHRLSTTCSIRYNSTTCFHISHSM